MNKTIPLLKKWLEFADKYKNLFGCNAADNLMDIDDIKDLMEDTENELNLYFGRMAITETNGVVEIRHYPEE